MMLPGKSQSQQTNFSKEIKGIVQRPKVIASIFGALLLVLLPYFHLGVIYTYWNTNKHPVNKRTCSCSCWDTFFKGTYESGNRPGYKHIYFNITHQTFKIWAMSGVTFIVFYETVKYLCQVVMARQVRLSMLVLFCADIFPHYYSWWMYFNAWNDDFYKQWYHQAFFTFTELTSTVVVLYLCNRSNEVRPKLALVIMSIAMLHILVSSGDQFVNNVLYQKGEWHQYTRDVGFMIPDLLHVVLPAYELVLLMRQNGQRYLNVFTPLELVMAVAGIGLLWVIIAHL